jgi:hypothetical protein
MGAQRVVWGALLVLALVLTVGGITAAAPLAEGVAEGVAENVARWVVAGGGGSSEGGGYSVRGSIGQAAVGAGAGGAYSLQSGFWGGAEIDQDDTRLFLPLIAGD